MPCANSKALAAMVRFFSGRLIDRSATTLVVYFTFGGERQEFFCPGGWLGSRHGESGLVLVQEYGNVHSLDTGSSLSQRQRLFDQQKDFAVLLAIYSLLHYP